MFHQGFQTLENNRIHSTVHQAVFIVLLKLQNTQDNKNNLGRFIFFRVSQILENNKNRLVNNLVKSIVLACLETLVKHSHSFLKYYLPPSLDEVAKVTVLVGFFAYMASILSSRRHSRLKILLSKK